MLRPSGDIVTFDARALRRWTCERQVCALHHPEGLGGLTFVALYSCDAVEGALLLLQQAEGVVLRVISPALRCLQEVRLPLRRAVRSTLSEDQTTLVVLGESLIFSRLIPFLC